MKTVVVKVGRAKAIAGLMWNTQKDQPDARKELAQNAQRDFLNAFSESDNFLISIKGAATNIANDYIQYGYTFNEKEATGTHSLALLFKNYAEKKAISWIAAFAISEHEYWVCACDSDGLIDSETDKVLSIRELNDYANDVIHNSKYEGVIFTDGCIEKTEEQLGEFIRIDLVAELQKTIKKSKKSKILPTTINVGKYVVAGVIISAVFATIGGLYYFMAPLVDQYLNPPEKEAQHTPPQGQKPIQIKAAAPENVTPVQAAEPPRSISEILPSPIIFAKNCLNGLDEKIYSPGDWKVEELTCADGKITGTYSYKSDTSKNALEELKEIKESYMLLAGNKIIIERKTKEGNEVREEEPMKSQNLYFTITGLMQSAGLELTLTEEVQTQPITSAPAQIAATPFKKFRLIIKGNGSPIKAAALLSSIPTARIQRINLIDLQKTEIEGEVYATERI